MRYERRRVSPRARAHEEGCVPVHASVEVRSEFQRAMQNAFVRYRSSLPCCRCGVNPPYVP